MENYCVIAVFHEQFLFKCFQKSGFRVLTFCPLDTLFSHFSSSILVSISHLGVLGVDSRSALSFSALRAMIDPIFHFSFLSANGSFELVFATLQSTFVSRYQVVCTIW